MMGRLYPNQGQSLSTILTPQEVHMDFILRAIELGVLCGLLYVGVCMIGRGLANPGSTHRRYDTHL